MAGVGEASFSVSEAAGEAVDEAEGFEELNVEVCRL